MPDKSTESTSIITGKSMAKLRERLQLNQSEFWSKVQVTQSGGSRYESGRNIPRAVRALIAIIYKEEIRKFSRALRAA